jgi:putative PIN family toxin of toxin-antitoxin system
MGLETGCQTVTVIFDSGVWVSAIRFGGVPRQAIVKALLQDEINICAEIENETVRIMRRKFAVMENEVRARMEIFLQKSMRVVVTGKLSGVCRDPKDDFILECAVTGNADCIVTGDKDLLSLDPYGSVGILTPRQYLDDAKHSPRRN